MKCGTWRSGRVGSAARAGGTRWKITGLDDFVDLVVLESQQCGLFRQECEIRLGGTRLP